ncbi:MAG: hypothetical protein WC249_00125 [Patescibacteria group bacterium]|jgi:hypothetical protein
MKKHFKLIFSLLALVALLILPYFVFATSTLGTLTEVAGNGGYTTEPTANLPTIIGLAIRTALSLLGTIFVILIVVAGYIWMTAEGSEEKVTKAQNYIRRAIIGLIITLSSWAIWTFILQRFIGA